MSFTIGGFNKNMYDKCIRVEFGSVTLVQDQGSSISQAQLCLHMLGKQPRCTSTPQLSIICFVNDRLDERLDQSLAHAGSSYLVRGHVAD